MQIEEGDETIAARNLIIKTLKEECFTVREEAPFYCDRKNYTADIYASISFIIELDPPSVHKGDHKTKKDKNRDDDIYHSYGVKTVRLQPSDVLKRPNGLALAFKEILHQLKQYDKTI